MADKIKNLRSYSNADKTRVVIDTDFKPIYSSDFSHDAKRFIIRIKNVDNALSALASVHFDQRSAVKKISKRLDKKDVRYIFNLDGTQSPKVFLLKPDHSHQYRLVIDFPHTATTRSPQQGKVKVLNPIEAAKLMGMGHGSGKPPIKTAEEADEAENKLIAKHQHKEQHEIVKDTKAPPPPHEITIKKPDPFIIAIDAGHGGKDPGAIGRRGVREKNVTLGIATALAKYINSNPLFRAVLIRRSDIYVELDRRSQLARKYKADILISVHADSVATGSKARGASVWVLSVDRANRENKKILTSATKEQHGYLLGGAGDLMTQKQAAANPYLSAAILDMTSDTVRSHGYSLGEEILKSLGKFTHLHKDSPIPASLAVLTSPDIPSLLIETGFLSNPYEEIQLNQPNYQKQIAYSIYQGINTYYQKYPASMFKSRQESERRYQSNRVHIVKAGESLSVIAKRYGISVQQLQRQNKLKHSGLKIGQKLVIPR